MFFLLNTNLPFGFFTTALGLTFASVPVSTPAHAASLCLSLPVLVSPVCHSVLIISSGNRPTF